MNGPQLRALLWLRWRLSSRQWRRGDAIGSVLSQIFLVLGVLLVIAGGIGGLLVGALALDHASARAVTFVWDGLVGAFLFFWAMGLVVELQRSEIIDLTRLMHLPIALRDVFLLNYIASHLSFCLALMVPAMLGVSVGLAFGRGAVMLLLVPLVVAFFFMVTAWTYCLRGWLATLMVNKRRRRTIVVTVTMIFILVSQMPNLLMNGLGVGRRDRSARTTVAQAQVQPGQVFDLVHRYVPPLWLPRGAGALARGHLWPALWGTLGMAAIGAWGLGRAYRTTIRFYRGSETSRPERTSAATASKGGVPGKLLVERVLPGVPEEASAVAFAGLRSLSRAPEVKMALATNVVIFVMLCLGPLLRMKGAPSPVFRPFLAGGAVAITFLGLMQIMFNSFGFDRGGFRALVLSPSRRSHILLGKNLALLPACLMVFGVNLVLVAILAHFGLVSISLAVLNFIAAYLVMSAVGSTLSILVPYRVSAGSMKPTKMRGAAQLLILGTHLLFPVAMLPVFLPAGLGLLFERLHWFPAGATSLIAAAILAVLAAFLYRLTLGPVGRLLQRREQAILQIVTQEVE